MYMHTLDEKPAYYYEAHGYQALALASNGHRVRAATLVRSLNQIRREQQKCIACDWRDYNSTKPEFRGKRPSIERYGYVLVAVPT